jgi:hypothetical protein
MQTTMRNCALCVAFAGALALGSAAPSSAAPALGGAALAKAFAGQQLTDVRWRRGWRYGYRYRRGCVIAGGYHREMSC